MTAKLLRIHGRVQGVGFRESMRQEAFRLQITGWVRNRRDGSVEALICGSEPQIRQMLEWAKNGPRFATVEQVHVAEAEPVVSDVFEIYFSK